MGSDPGLKMGDVSRLKTGDGPGPIILFDPNTNDLCGDSVAGIYLCTLTITSCDKTRHVKYRGNNNISQDSWVVLSPSGTCSPCNDYLDICLSRETTKYFNITITT